MSRHLDPAALDTLRALNSPGEPDIVLELVQLFTETTPPRLEAMRQALSRNDIQGVTSQAHTIKSSSANLGAFGLSELAKTIEALKVIDPLSGIIKLIEDLEQEYSRVKTALEAECRRNPRVA